MFHKIILVLFVAALIGACKKKDATIKVPTIKLIYASDSVTSGSSKDTVKISFEFEDGDADIVTDGKTLNIFVSNTRDTNKFNYPFPYIDDAFKDPTSGFKGTCMIRIPAAFILIDDPNVQKDSTQFMVKIKDAANHFSNEIITPKVFLLK